LAAVIKIHHGFDESYESWGRARHALKDRTGAIEKYTEAIRIRPDWGIPYVGRALARFEGGELPGAEEDARKALRCDLPSEAVEVGKRLLQGLGKSP
jgi:tetratricopeptide (TPR) repeat protein